MMPKPLGDGPPADDRRRVLTHYRFGVGSAKCVKVCAACGCRCGAEENFCTECGERLPEKNLYEQSVAGKRRCTECGSLLGDARRFCPICGTPLKLKK